MKTYRLKDLKIDESIQVREVNSHTVGTYKQAIMAGTVFPPLVVEKSTGRVVCGNHRYFAQLKAYGEEHEIECIEETYATEADIIKRAAADNSRHGRPLDTWEKKKIILRLKDFGTDIEEISKIISVPADKIRVMAGMTVVVVGKRGKSTYKHIEPLKHGLEHLAGGTVTEEQYQEHAEKDRGVGVGHLAATIIRWIENGWIDMENKKTAKAMKDLQTAINSFI